MVTESVLLLAIKTRECWRQNGVNVALKIYNECATDEHKYVHCFIPNLLRNKNNVIDEVKQRQTDASQQIFFPKLDITNLTTQSCTLCFWLQYLC